MARGRTCELSSTKAKAPAFSLGGSSTFQDAVEVQGQGSGRQGDAVLSCGISWCYAIDAGARGALVADALAYGSCTERLASLVSVASVLHFAEAVLFWCDASMRSCSACFV